MAGIYIHIPYCKKACHYCNFHFSTTKYAMGAMTEAITRELELQKDYLQEPVETIYFGGGTPSILPSEDIEKILHQLRTHYRIVPGAEITLEANPDDIDLIKLAAWSNAGINRLSIGIQSFFEEDLRWMNRAHNAAQAEGSVALARQHGFDNITIDLIYGTPTLTDDKWQANFDKAMALGVPHLSCYALTVEPQTALDKLIAVKKIPPVETERQSRQFDLLMQWARVAGLEHYEISNFAKPGYRSRHNSSYWQGKPYLGIGPSAHSFNGVERQWNVANNNLYLKSIEQGMVPYEKEILTAENRINEYIMTSLRTAEGLNLQQLEQLKDAAFAENVLKESADFINKGQMLYINNHLILTQPGKHFADGIAAELFV
jgi:oxygen-independent coproporphyrinogen III oxidase